MNTSPMANLSFELLADYVEGFVDAPTAERIEDQLKEDEVSREIVNGIRYWFDKHGDDREGLEEYLADFEERLKNRLQTPDTTNTEAGSSRSDLKPESGGSSRLFLRIAAACILIAGALAISGIFKPPVSPDAMVMAEISDYYRAPGTTRGAEQDDVRWSAFKTAWANEAFEEAYVLGQQLSEVDEEKFFYTGMAALYSEHYQQASERLRQLAGISELYGEQALWFSALAMFQQGEREYARGLLEKIAAEDGHFKQREAAKLLEKSF